MLTGKPTRRNVNLLDARAWTPYGVEVGGAQSGLGYTGEWFDAVVGLEYLHPSGYLSRALIAESLGKGNFSEVVDWFGALNTAAPTPFTKDTHGRWGFLALLLHANTGDRIAGLSLGVFGQQRAIDLGRIMSNGCSIQVMVDGNVYDLPEYIQDYLEDVNASDDDRIQYQVPNWRSVVHRHQLNNGRKFKDGLVTDLPSFCTVGWGGDFYSLVPGILGPGVSGNGVLITDRYGHDYISFSLGAAAGIQLTPFLTGLYSEGYVGGPAVLEEDVLSDAIKGWDLEGGLAVGGITLGGSLSIDSVVPLGIGKFKTGQYGVDLVTLLGVSLSGSFTFSF